jgi:serine/threonine protein kinase/WD40 repeat protein
MRPAERCSHCGSALLEKGALAGLCPECLLELATATAGDDDELESDSFPSLTSTAAGEALRPGRIVAQRYRLLRMLGRGGMGEVWRAFDFKLRVDVALKTLRSETLHDEATRETLRQEVRAARQVVSPNVCRVFDLVGDTGDTGLEMISMEYVEGMTLARLLAERGPLDLAAAGQIAAQMLAGVQAIHQAGLVHRDLKPGNVMVTPAGRAVVMDFGVARKLVGYDVGTLIGTPAYMAPEQADGKVVDARADVFAAGLVLSEMVGGGSAWEPVLRRASAADPGDRHASAGALARALEEIALRAAEAGSRSPYPGLRTFTEEDAADFFGRELEVEAMLRRLRGSRLLALIGPSGAGKSSFLRAGLMASLPGGWSVALCTPGDRPLPSLVQALASKADRGDHGDGSGPSFDEPPVTLAKRWRARHEQALLIVDQFEELFTLNAQDEQASFAELLGRLPLECDVHVLLSLRDDFLFHCESHEALRPVFSDVTPLGPPAGAALRRALVQPALRAGYRFEDERLVDDMLAEVERERGALPLLAFAAARLWERRDRQRGLLTRRAYREIGGVGGALAGHAEATLVAIGTNQEPIVRELFRNLVTAEGTRAARSQDELLSVFEDGQAAERVLSRLVDARLLTSFEVPPDEEGRRTRRIEIIHESLLTAWPRLVRWRGQDAEGAQLRDQLRQAAHLWEERGRPADLLWTETSYREFALWRERYPGRLTSVEEAFARAMVEQAGRRRKRRRLAVSGAMAALLVVLAVVLNFWLQSRASARQARLEARRAEAQQLFALGQLEIERHPTVALAYATASLEKADSDEVRRFALRVLWRGPTTFLLGRSSGEPHAHITFSPDGRWLATAEGGRLHVWGQGGAPPLELDAGRPMQAAGRWPFGFRSDSRVLFVWTNKGARLYGLPDGQEIRRVDREFRWGFVRGGQLITTTALEPADQGTAGQLVEAWGSEDGEPRTLGTWRIPEAFWPIDVELSAGRVFLAREGDLYEAPLDRVERPAFHLIARGDDPICGFRLHPDGEQVFTWHRSGAVRVRSRRSGAALRELAARPVVGVWRVPDFTPDGRWLTCANGNDQTVFLWDLAALPGSDPLVLRRGAVTSMLGVAVHPGGSWMATRDYLGVSLWPLARKYAHVLRGPEDQLRGRVALDPAGQWVAAGGQMENGRLWIWPWAGDGKAKVVETGVRLIDLQAAPDGRALAVGTPRGVRLLHLDGRPPKTLPGFEGPVLRLRFDRAGRRVAAGGGLNDAKEAVTRIWDLETGDVKVLDAGDGQIVISADFLPDGRLLTGGVGGLRIWDVEARRSTLVAQGVVSAVVGPDGRYALGMRAPRMGGVPAGKAFVYDLAQKREWSLDTHGDTVTSLAWDPSGTRVVTGSRDGMVRVGPMTGEEPHLLLGHEGPIGGVDVDRSGHWIASSSEDRTVRLWPMPEGPPFHALPHADLLDRLRLLTNYRLVADAAAPGGYRITFEPFMGWNSQPPVW